MMNNENATIPNIKIRRHWDADSVRQACIKNNLYTCGDNKDYERMFCLVKQLYPNFKNLYFVAKDIAEHSKGQTISNVMFILENKAVTTSFEIDGEEE